MTIRVVIKGSPEDARQAAKRKGITLSDVKAGHHGCTTARCGRRFAKPVWDWYHERHAVATGTGYPAGTLIVYRER